MKNEPAKSGLKKVYVVCGDVRIVCHAAQPLDACHIALNQKGDSEMLGSHFYIDERGFRDNLTKNETCELTGEKLSAQWTVPVEKLFAETGQDSYGDLDDDPAGGAGVPLVPSPSGGPTSAQG